MKRFLVVSVATLACLNAHAKESVESRLDRLEAENRYLRDYLDIWKLQSLYAHYWNINAPKEIVALFADSPEVEIELSNKGVLKGRDAPHRYYLRKGTAGEIKDAVPPRPSGSLVLHTAVNPVLEINRDGTRARAVWLSPGITNFRRDGEMIAAWNYGKYEMEYLKQGGRWKILAFRWHQMFLSPYDKGWAKENVDPGPGGVGPLQPDRASAAGFYNPYRVDKINPFDPPPPVPYKE
jgi:hypothetical protein